MALVIVAWTSFGGSDTIPQGVVSPATGSAPAVEFGLGSITTELPVHVLFVLSESVMLERPGVMALTAALLEHGHSVKIVLAGRLGANGLFRTLEDQKPRIVAYSAMTGEHMRLLEINRTLKSRFSFTSVFGGPHPTFAPEMIAEPGVDAICVGEGDEAFPDFCDRMDSGAPYWETPNFHVRHDGEVHRNAVRPLIQDLDNLPFPNRELMYEADPRLRHDGLRAFFATRGCPHRCTYCFNRTYNEIYGGSWARVRHRSPENLVDEICEVRARYGATVIFMHDDLFLLKPKSWIERFSELYRARVGLPLGCSARPDYISDTRIAPLRRAGLYAVWVGVETADDDIARGVLQRGHGQADVRVAAAVLRRHGVHMVTQNLIGLPVPDSYARDLATLDLNIELAPLLAQASIVYPYPGTAIEGYARENGFLPDGHVPVHETNKRSSAFTFPLPGEQQRIENLHKLFSIVVRFPLLRPYVDKLCELPFGSLYRALYYANYGYSLRFKLFPMGSLPQEIWGHLALFTRLVLKS